MINHFWMTRLDDDLFAGLDVPGHDDAGTLDLCATGAFPADGYGRGTATMGESGTDTFATGASGTSTRIAGASGTGAAVMGESGTDTFATGAFG
ncbi:hypothetical protein AB0K60_24690 [Thermopolyspora sp. NPDC052614]|uniref:hypothetical protein n=1 Tax=Thermopolyspora sp. NPDC052614 TaxID=3155682 RepID=UPI0034353B29